MSPDVKSELAPTGVLRAGDNPLRHKHGEEDHESDNFCSPCAVGSCRRYGNRERPSGSTQSLSRDFGPVPELS